MNQGDFLSRVRSALDGAGVPHMLAGSFASSCHGEPRSTHDLDVVIDPSRDSLLALLDRFPAADYHVSRPAAMEAPERRTQFNVVDYATGWKVDFIVRKDRDFSREEFSRRKPLDVLGTTFDAASAEYAILSKLEWAKLGGSDRQVEDAAGVIRMQGEAFDRAYLARWAGVLGVEPPWRDAEARAGARGSGA